jgi:type IV pilus assembly protein PilY1
MLRFDHDIRWRYLAVILTWVGYASGLSAAPLQLESTPLFLNVKAEPNVLLMIDDSGSMNWEVMTGDYSNDGRYTNTQRDGSSRGAGHVVHRDNDDNGQPDCGFGSPDQSFYGYAYGVEFPTNGDRSPDSRNCNTADDAEWRFRNYNFNVLYFDPNHTYVPWAGVDAAGNRFQAMNIHAAKDNPYDPNSRTLDLTRHNSTGDPNITSDRNHDGLPDGWRYYTWTDMNGNGRFEDGEETVHFIKDEPANQQNFANWFSYYRKREYVVKAVYGELIASLSQVRAGLVTLHNGVHGINPQVTSSNTPLTAIDVDPQAPNQVNSDPTRGNRRALLDALYSFKAQGGTSLRHTLANIGDYLENANSGGRVLFPNDDAYLTAANGGACQQSFVILMSDGSESGAPPTVGNTDNPSGADGSTPFNGGPYADSVSNTLADVAMHYYQRDLRPALNDLVPTSPLDQASHQHMVTYTITFSGFNGSLSRNPFPSQDGRTFWPDPYAREAHPQFSIDDLRHAAFNGRGQFFQTSDAASLLTALRSAVAGIAAHTSTAGPVTLNTGARTASSRLYQARFDSSSWSGQLLSFKIDPATGNPLQTPQSTVDSGTLLNQLLSDSNYDTTVRTILTYKPSTASGIPFAWSQLDAAQQAALHTDMGGVMDHLGQARLAYLRGSNVDEGQGNGFRVRAHRLGDFIDSAPFFVGPPALPDEVDPHANDPTQTNAYVQFRDNPTNHNRTPMVLIGGNDGMLHIFNANNPYDPATGQGDHNAGQEMLAYLPHSVLKHTVALTSPTYQHRYYVNGSPTAGDVFLPNRGGWRTVAVGGLGAGGQGYFALDITEPATFQENTTAASRIVLWEFTDLDDADLGLTFSQPSLVRMHNGQWAAVVGNGYNNAGTGHAVFFVLFLDGPGAGGRWAEGVNYIKIDTGVGDTTTPNGLATPAVVDVDGDFTADYLVAGDLRGNMWRIDVTSTAPQVWQQPAQRALLFTATDDSGTPQPITARPAVGKHPDGLAGFVVYFGTGKYLERIDNMTTGAPTQTFYGIWDKNLLGARVLRSDLLQQMVLAAPTVTGASGKQHLTRVTSDHVIDWQTRRGFYLDLPAPGERQVSEAILRSGRIIFSTLIPNDQPCSFGGTSFLFALDVHGGVRPSTPFFDMNQDRLFNNQDKVMVNTLLVPPSAIDPGVGIVHTPTLQVSGPTRDDTHVGAATIGTNRDNEPAGRQAWRRITQ